MNKIRIGLIGLGRMGQFHLNVIRQIDTLTLSGVFDTDLTHSKSIAVSAETSSFDSIENLFKVSDAVIIATPTSYHFEIAAEAIKHGIHVLVEKPMTETYKQAETISSLLDGKNLVFQVGHVERFNGAVSELKHVVESPILIEARRLAPFTNRISDVGVVFDIMIHDLDIILSLVKSKLIRYSAVGKRIRTSHEDIASAILEFDGGTIATISASRITEEKIRTLTISAADAYFMLDYATQDITIHRQAASQSKVKSFVGINYRQESTIERVFIHRDNPLKLEVEHFAKCILGIEKPQVSVESDIQTIKITESILKQIKETW